MRSSIGKKNEEGEEKVEKREADSTEGPPVRIYNGNDSCTVFFSFVFLSFLFFLPSPFSCSTARLFLMFYLFLVGRCVRHCSHGFLSLYFTDVVSQEHFIHTFVDLKEVHVLDLVGIFNLFVPSFCWFAFCRL